MPGVGRPAAAAEARALGATCGGVRVWSLYVPNGRALDDPHYAYKLDWLAALRGAGAGWLAGDPDAAVALVRRLERRAARRGRLGPGGLRGLARTSPPAERAAFAAVVDGRVRRPGRDRTRPARGVYTYWDYQQLRFPKREGMRIDFVLGFPGAGARRVSGALIDREERKGKGAERPRPGRRRPRLTAARADAQPDAARDGPGSERWLVTPRAGGVVGPVLGPAGRRGSAGWGRRRAPGRPVG